MDWRHRAACIGIDPELWFPVGTGGPALLQTQEAKAVCARCPVNAECLDWALEMGVSDGVWGGLSENERRVLNQPPAPAASVLPPGEWCNGKTHQHLRTKENTYRGANNSWVCRDCDRLRQRNERERRNARVRERRAERRRERESRTAV